MKNSHSRKNIALFIMRLILGAFFIVHGITKFQHMDGTISFFVNNGFAPFFAYVTAIIEIGGGALMILGLFTKTVAFIFSIMLLVIIFKVRLPGGGFKGAELEIIYLAGTLGLMLMGSGRFALFRGKCWCCSNCKDGVCGCFSGTCTGCGCSTNGGKLPQ